MEVDYMLAPRDTEMSQSKLRKVRKTKIHNGGLGKWARQKI